MSDPTRLEILVDLRKQVQPRLSQSAVARIFELEPKQGRKSVAAWENGTFPPEENKRRDTFVTYLWDVLGLRGNPEQFEQVWQILVEEWKWDPISDEEWASFTNVPRPIRATVEGQAPRAIIVPDPPEPLRPPYADRFVGRQTELNGYKEKLEHTGIAQVTGAAGVGKTAVAAQLAQQSGTEDLIFWHSCYPDRDAYTVIWGLAEFFAWLGRDDIWTILHTASQSGSLPAANTLYDSLFEMMRGEEFVLCFDNFHYIYSDESQRELVDRIVSAVRNKDCKLIVTSQQTIDLDGVIAEPLGGMSLTDAKTFLHTRGLPLDEVLVQQLHERTSGNAALLTLSAQALQKSDKPEQLIEQLVKTAEVEKFLLEEIDNVLIDDEKMVMSGVSALLGFPGTADAIEEVLDDDEVRRPLAHLVNRYLLEKQLNEDLHDTTYSQHEIVQRFYYQLLGRSRKREMHARAAEYYEYEVEDDFLAALHYQHSRKHEKSAILATRNVFAHLHRGRAPAVRLLLEKQKRNGLPEILWAKVQIALGHAYEFIEEWEPALERYQDAIQQLDAIPEAKEVRSLQIEAYRGIAIVLRYRRPEEALTWIEQGLDIATGIDPVAEADLRIQMGAALLRAQNSQARTPLEQALALLDSASSTPKVDRLKRLARLNLGIHLYYKNEMAAAGEHWQEALTLADKNRDSFNGLSLRINLAALYHITGPFETALEHYKSAIDIATQFGKKVEIARIHCNVGALYINLADYDEAEEHLHQSLELAEKIGQTEIVATTLTYLGDLRLHQNLLDDALTYLEEADALATDSKLTFQQPTIYRLLATYHLQQNEIEQAKGFAEQAADTAKESGIQIEEGAALRVLGQVQADLGQVSEAKSHFEQSVELLKDNPYELRRTHDAVETSLPK